MKKFVRSIALVATATIAAGTLVAGLGGVAHAGTAPPWEPDANSVGGLAFFNSTGQQITGGNLTDSPIAAYVEGASTVRAGDQKATLYGYVPVAGTSPGTWSGEALGSSTSYPNASAPAPLTTSTLPVETGSSGDETVATLEADLPNTNAVGSGYAGLYQLRLKTTATGKSPNTTYDSADIQITGSTWSVVYTAQTTTATTTTLAVAPVSPQVGGTNETLTATVSPSAATGTVQFENGGVAIGAPVAVTGGTAATTTSTLPVGTDSLSAVFTPTVVAAPFATYSGSTGTASLTVTQPPAASTVTALSINPTTAAADTSVALTAALTSSGSALASGAGQVSFYDNGTSTVDTATGTLLGTVALGSGGIATLNYSSFATGTHNIVASFAPTSLTTYQASLSLSLPFVATAPTYAPDAQTVDVSIPAGTLTITTPYDPSNPFNLGTAVLDPADSKFTASASFGTPATDGTNAGGVTVTDTRAGQQGWSASAVASNFTDGATPTPDVINAQDLTFTNVQAQYLTGNALQSGVVTTAIGNTAIYGPTATGTDGLGGVHQFASAPVGDSDGSVYINGLLTLVAPTSTPAGSYTATITFTIS
jgi:hypothetical protein